MVKNEGDSKCAYVFQVFTGQMLQSFVNLEFYLSVLNLLAQKTEADMQDLAVLFWKVINLLRNVPSDHAHELKNGTRQARVQLQNLKKCLRNRCTLHNVLYEVLTSEQV